MLGSVKTVKGTEKGGDSELAGLLSKMSAKFEQNLKATEKIIAAIKASFSSDKSQNRIMKELLTLNEKLAQKGTQNFRKSGGDGALKNMNELVKHGLKEGSIYVADVVSHRLLKNIMLQMQGKATDAKLMSKRRVEKIYNKYTGDDGGDATATAGGSGGGGSGGGGGGGGGGISDYESGLLGNAGILTTLKLQGLNKFKDLLEDLERSFFGLSEKSKSFSESFSFSSIIGAETKFIGDIREAAYETGNVTKQTQGLLRSYEQIDKSVAQTGMDRDAFQESYMKNLRSGLKNQKEAQKVAITQLNTERQLGLSAGDLNETFREFAIAGRMSTVQISTMGMGMRNVARNTGLTGEALKSAITASKTFVDNLRNAAQLSSSSATNVTELTARFQELGVSDVGGEISKYLTSSTQVLLEGSSQTANFLYMAAASAGKVSELQQGTLTKSKQGIKSLAAGMEQVLKNFGVDSLDAIDKIPDDVKTTLNLQLKTVTGMELGQLRSVIEATKETGKTFSDRLEDINKKREKNLTLEERTALKEEERRLKASKGIEVLTALDEASKGASDMSTALDIFSRRRKDFEQDIQAMGGAFGSGIEAARTSITTSIDEINKGLVKAGKTQLKIDISEIEEALRNPVGLRELVSKIQAGDKELATAQKSQLDPARAAQQTLMEVNDQLRSYSSSALSYMKALVGELGFMTVAITAVGAGLLINTARSYDTLVGIRKDPKKNQKANATKPEASGGIMGFLANMLGLGGEKPTATPPPIIPPKPPKVPPPPAGINVALLANAAALGGLVIALAAVATGLMLITGIMVKKFNIKPEELMAGAAAITIMMIGLVAVMAALGGGMYLLDKNNVTTGKVMGMGKQLLKIMAITAIMGLASTVLVALAVSLGSTVKQILSKSDLGLGDGIKGAAQITETLMVAGALIGVIAGIFQLGGMGVSGMGGSWRSMYEMATKANILKTLALIAVVGTILYFAGPLIVQFATNVVYFVDQALSSLDMDVSKILMISAKLGAVMSVTGILVASLVGFAFAVDLIGKMPMLNMRKGLFRIMMIAPYAAVILALGVVLVGLISAVESLAGFSSAQAMSSALTIVAISIAVGSIVGALIGISYALTLINGIPTGAFETAGKNIYTIGTAITAIMVIGTVLLLAGWGLSAIGLTSSVALEAAAIISIIAFSSLMIGAALWAAMQGLLMINTASAAVGTQGFTAGPLLLYAVTGLLLVGLAFLVGYYAFNGLGLTYEMILDTTLIIGSLLLGAFVLGAAFLLGAAGLALITWAGLWIGSQAIGASAGMLWAIAGIALFGLALVGMMLAVKYIDTTQLLDLTDKIMSFAEASIYIGAAMIMLAVGSAQILVGAGSFALVGLLAAGALALSVYAFISLSTVIKGIIGILGTFGESDLKSGASKMKSMAELTGSFNDSINMFKTSLFPVLETIFDPKGWFNGSIGKIDPETIKTKIADMFSIMSAVYDEISKSPINTRGLESAKTKLGVLMGVIPPFVSSLEAFKDKLLPLFKTTGWWASSKAQQISKDAEDVVNSGNLTRISQAMSNLVNQISTSFQNIKVNPAVIESMSKAMELPQKLGSMITDFENTINVLDKNFTVKVKGANKSQKFSEALETVTPEIVGVVTSIGNMIEKIEKIPKSSVESMENAKKKIMETSSASKSIAELLAVFVNDIMPYFTDSGGSNNIKKVAAFTNNKAWNEYHKNIEFLMQDDGFFLRLENIIHKFYKVFAGWEVKDLNIVKDKILAIKDSISGLQGGLSEFVKIIPFLTDKNNIDAFKKLNEGKPENSVLYLMTKAIIDQLVGPIMKSGYTPDKLSEALKVMTTVFDMVTKIDDITKKFSGVITGESFKEITEFLNTLDPKNAGGTVNKDSLVKFFDYIDKNLLTAISTMDLDKFEDSMSKMNQFTEVLDTINKFMKSFKMLGDTFNESFNGNMSISTALNAFTQDEDTMSVVLRNVKGQFRNTFKGIVAFAKELNNLTYMIDEVDIDWDKFNGFSEKLSTIGELTGPLSKFITDFKTISGLQTSLPDALDVSFSNKVSGAIQSIAKVADKSIVDSLTIKNTEMESLSEQLSIFAGFVSEIKQSYISIIDDMKEIGKTQISQEILKTLETNLQTFSKISTNSTVPATGATQTTVPATGVTQTAVPATGVTQVPATANVFADEATRKRFAASMTNTTQTANVPAVQSNPLVANNPDKQAAMSNAATTNNGAAVVQEENSEPILDTLISISESINSFLAAAARGGGRSVTAGSNVPFVDRIGVDPKLGKRMNGDFAAGDGVNGTYTG
jgi:hypothetical protein